MVKNATEGPCWDDGIEVLSGTPVWLRLAARSDVKTADRLVQFIHVMIDLPDSEKDIVAAALRELLLNAIEYGGKFDPEQYVELSYLRTKRAVTCRVKDPGEGFSFDEISHSAVMNPPHDPLRHVHFREAQNLRPGGFGVLLARNSVDELIYNEQGNDVLLIKYV
jgi:anti-sigma regulatory factor (Ser/Thr protein kinase)